MTGNGERGVWRRLRGTDLAAGKEVAAAKEVENAAVAPTPINLAAALLTPLEHEPAAKTADDASASATGLNFDATKEVAAEDLAAPNKVDSSDLAELPKDLAAPNKVDSSDLAELPKDLADPAALRKPSTPEGPDLGEKLIAVSMYDLSPDSLYFKLLPKDRSDMGAIKYLPANSSPKEIHDAASRLLFRYNQGGSRRARENAQRAAAEQRNAKANRTPAAADQSKGKGLSCAPAADQRASSTPSAISSASAARRLVAPVHNILHRTQWPNRVP